MHGLLLLIGDDRYLDTEKVLERGEQIDLLVDKTENLESEVCVCVRVS